MHIIVISGRSGSGKSIALHALEDLGFYCVDNLPIQLLDELIKATNNNHASLAISIDSRNLSENDQELPNIMKKIEGDDKKLEIIYLDAEDNILLQRFSETRRKHPLSNKQTSLRQAIKKEQTLLSSIANLADFTLNTTKLSQHELHNLIRDKIIYSKQDQLQIQIQSFGFKYGLPPDTDYIFDVRCLPNPYWDKNLRQLTGLDLKVSDFLNSNSLVNKMLEDIYNFSMNWIPQFKIDNRSYLSIAIGCTGGRHRSVFLADKLSSRLEAHFENIVVKHRELNL